MSDGFAEETQQRMEKKRRRMALKAMDHMVARQNEEVRNRDECLWCDGEVRDEDYEWKYAAAGGVLAGPFCDSGCQWMWLHEQNNGREEYRKCPFKGCTWSITFTPGLEHEEWMADAEAESHYEDEHAGRAKVQVVVEKEVIVGDRDAHQVADQAHDDLVDEVPGYEVAFARTEVIDEPSDHSRVVTDS